MKHLSPAANLSVRIIVLLALMAVTLLSGSARLLANEGFSLDAIRGRVASDYPAVSQLSTAELAELLGRDDNVLLFDVREEGEYAVSRIPGAVRVDPGIWTFSFMGQFGEAVRGKTVIFYCSVGVRSSKLAAQVQEEVMEAGATRVHNLDGGVFAWHNEERPLVNDQGETDFVHPYDPYWGQLVERSELLRMRPE